PVKSAGTRGRTAPPPQQRSSILLTVACVAEGGSDAAASSTANADHRLLRLSDASGTLTFHTEQEGAPVFAASISSANAQLRCAQPRQARLERRVYRRQWRRSVCLD